MPLGHRPRLPHRHLTYRPLVNVKELAQHQLLDSLHLWCTCLPEGLDVKELPVPDVEITIATIQFSTPLEIEIEVVNKELRMPILKFTARLVSCH